MIVSLVFFSELCFEMCVAFLLLFRHCCEFSSSLPLFWLCLLKYWRKEEIFFLSYLWNVILLSNCVCFSDKMASTFTATSSIGSMVAPNGHKSDKKLMNKLSSSSFGRRQNVCPRLRRSSPAIVCAAKELHFNKDGTTIRRLQVRFLFFFFILLVFPKFTKGFAFLLGWCQQACRPSWCYTWT